MCVCARMFTSLGAARKPGLRAQPRASHHCRWRLCFLLGNALLFFSFLLLFLYAVLPPSPPPNPLLTPEWSCAAGVPLVAVQRSGRTASLQQRIRSPPHSSWAPPHPPAHPAGTDAVRGFRKWTSCPAGGKKTCFCFLLLCFIVRRRWDEENQSLAGELHTC